MVGKYTHYLPKTKKEKEKVIVFSPFLVFLQKNAHKRNIHLNFSIENFGILSAEPNDIMASCGSMVTRVSSCLVTSRPNVLTKKS